MCHRQRAQRKSPYRTTNFDLVDGPADVDLRASDADREGVAGTLRAHGAEGRLGVDELEERIAAAFSARTHGELQQLLRDLPGGAPLPRVGRPRRHRAGLARVVQIAALLVAIWALTGAGYFWPVWPIVGLLWFTMPWRGRSRAPGIP